MTRPNATVYGNNVESWRNFGMGSGANASSGVMIPTATSIPRTKPAAAPSRRSSHVKPTQRKTAAIALRQNPSGNDHTNEDDQKSHRRHRIGFEISRKPCRGRLIEPESEYDPYDARDESDHHICQPGVESEKYIDAPTATVEDPVESVEAVQSKKFSISAIRLLYHASHLSGPATTEA